jgi:hypothetical protein
VQPDFWKSPILAVVVISAAPDQTIWGFLAAGRLYAGVVLLIGILHRWDVPFGFSHTTGEKIPWISPLPQFGPLLFLRMPVTA